MRSNSPPGEKTWYPVMSTTKLRPSPHTISSLPTRNSPGPSPGRPKFRTWRPERSTTTPRVAALAPGPSSRYKLPAASKPTPSMVENCSHSATASVDPMRYTNSKSPGSGRSSAGKSTTSWAPTPLPPKTPANAVATHIPPMARIRAFRSITVTPPVGSGPVTTRSAYHRRRRCEQQTGVVAHYGGV